MAKKKKTPKTPSSAKDINIYKVADYAPQTKKSEEKALQYMQNLTNAKTFKFNAEQADLTRDFNKQEAETARNWQTEMSNTAHQREVADLKKAGLNPVLSANTGAQSYSTSAASAQNASAAAQSAATAVSGYAQSVLSSNATKYAARQSAAATRYAANMNYASAVAQAEAAKYGYQAQFTSNMVNGYLNRFQEHWKTTFDWRHKESESAKDRESAEKQTEYKADRTAFGILGGIAKMVVGAFTGYDSKTGTKGKSGFDQAWNAVSKGFAAAGHFTGVDNYWKATNSQKADLGRVLMAIDMNNTAYNQKMLLRAFSGDKSAQRYIYRHKKKSKSGKF